MVVVVVREFECQISKRGDKVSKRKHTHTHTHTHLSTNDKVTISGWKFSDLCSYRTASSRYFGELGKKDWTWRVGMQAAFAVQSSVERANTIVDVLWP